MSDTWWCVWTGDTLLSFFPWLNFVYCRAKKSSLCLFRFPPPFFFFTQLLISTNSCLYVSPMFSWEMAAFWHNLNFKNINLTQTSLTSFLVQCVLSGWIKNPWRECQFPLIYFENPQTIFQKFIISNGLLLLKFLTGKNFFFTLFF